MLKRILASLAAVVILAGPLGRVGHAACVAGGDFDSVELPDAQGPVVEIILKLRHIAFGEDGAKLLPGFFEQIREQVFVSPAGDYDNYTQMRAIGNAIYEGNRKMLFCPLDPKTGHRQMLGMREFRTALGSEARRIANQDVYDSYKYPHACLLDSQLRTEQPELISILHEANWDFMHAVKHYEHKVVVNKPAVKFVEDVRRVAFYEIADKGERFEQDKEIAQALWGVNLSGELCSPHLMNVEQARQLVIRKLAEKDRKVYSSR